MTKTQTAFDALIADLNAAQTSASKAEHGIADIACHIVAAVMDGEKGGNYPKLQGTVTRVSGKGKERKETQHVVCVDVAHLTKFAQGALSQAEVSETFDALASIAPKVQAARAQYAELSKLKGQDRALFAAEISAAKTKAHTVSQQLRRPLRAAAALIVDPAFDAATVQAKTSKGSRVIMADKTVKAGKAEITKRVSVSTKQIDDLLSAIASKAGNAKAKRAPQQTKAKAVVVEPNTVAMDKKTFSRDSNRNVAQVAQAMAQGLDDMTDALKPAERQAVITMIMSAVHKLDAQGKSELFNELKSVDVVAH